VTCGNPEHVTLARGNIWRSTALKGTEGDEFGKVRKDYCFECGCYAGIDDMTKLCDRCYRRWLDRRQLGH
jgi:hypothetical protein